MRRRRSVVVAVVAVLVRGFDRDGLLRFVVVRVVPRLPRAGREQVVEGRREEVHAGRDQEHDPPLRDRGLEEEIKHVLLGAFTFRNHSSN